MSYSHLLLSFALLVSSVCNTSDHRSPRKTCLQPCTRRFYTTAEGQQAYSEWSARPVKNLLRIVKQDEVQLPDPRLSESAAKWRVMLPR